MYYQYFGTRVKASINELIVNFGIQTSVDPKSHVIFYGSSSDGVPFCLYDWKEPRKPRSYEQIYFHLGARSEWQERMVKEYLKSMNFQVVEK